MGRITVRANRELCWRSAPATCSLGIWPDTNSSRVLLLLVAVTGSCGRKLARAIRCECSIGRGRTTMLRYANQSRSLLVGGACRPVLSVTSHFILLTRCLIHSDGHYGLYLDETLYEGSSARCPTFNNDPLCTSDPSPGKGGNGGGNGGTATFECVGLEVWGIGLS